MMYEVRYGSQKWNFDSKARAIEFARLLAESESDEIRVVEWKVLMDIMPNGDQVETDE